MKKKKFQKGKRYFMTELCPCGRSNKDGKFAPYEGQTKFGYCHSCCKSFNEYNSDQPITQIKSVPSKPRLIKYLDASLVEKSMDNHNIFVDGLFSRFEDEKVNRVLGLYKIGTSTYWNGATVFWQIDEYDNVRTGKIILYDATNLKRLIHRITWEHFLQKIPNENTEKCLFGLHLLRKFPGKTIYLVESEKTAIIASIFFPEYIWMATACKGNLKYELLKPLKGRKIVLIPDLDAYEDWCKGAESLKRHFDLSVSNYLQKKASIDDIKAKFDLADFLLKK
jgi:hypothetical protein